MSSAANKFVTAALLAAIAAACGNSEKKQAESLHLQAIEAVECGNYMLADQLLDSLDSRYKSQVAVRRQGLNTRAKAKEGVTLQQLTQTDSLTVLLNLRADSLRQYVKWVDNPVEGYFMAQGDKAVTKNGLQGRVSPDNVFYLVSTIADKKPRHTSVTLSVASGQSVTTPDVPFDGELNSRDLNRETVLYSGAQCMDVGRFAATHRSESVTITFNGSSPTSRRLSAAELTALAQIWEYGDAVQSLTLAALERQRLETVLSIARQQTARTSTD